MNSIKKIGKTKRSEHFYRDRYNKPMKRTCEFQPADGLFKENVNPKYRGLCVKHVPAEKFKHASSIRPSANNSALVQLNGNQ